MTICQFIMSYFQTLDERTPHICVSHAVAIKVLLGESANDMTAIMGCFEQDAGVPDHHKCRHKAEDLCPHFLNTKSPPQKDIVLIKACQRPCATF